MYQSQENDQEKEKGQKRNALTFESLVDDVKLKDSIGFERIRKPKMKIKWRETCFKYLGVIKF